MFTLSNITKQMSRNNDMGFSYLPEYRNICFYPHSQKNKIINHHRAFYDTYELDVEEVDSISINNTTLYPLVLRYSGDVRVDVLLKECTGKEYIGECIFFTDERTRKYIINHIKRIDDEYLSESSEDEEDEIEDEIEDKLEDEIKDKVQNKRENHL